VKAAQPAHFHTVTDAPETAPWLTLLHGATQHSGLFSAQIAFLRDRYRLLLVDLPGHGRSAGIAGPYGQVEYAAHVSAAMDAAGVRRTHLWGTHTGAAVGLLLAHGQPGRISSLILDGAVLPGAAMPYTTFAINRARATAKSRGMAAARDEWFNACDWFDVIRTRPVECRAVEHRQLIEAFPGGPWLDESAPAPVPTLEPLLPSMTVPVLLVSGEHDVPEFLATAQTLRSAMPRAEQIVIPGGGGFPLWEFPAAVNAPVEAFLGRVSAPHRGMT